MISVRFWLYGGENIRKHRAMNRYFKLMSLSVKIVVLGSLLLYILNLIHTKIFIHSKGYRANYSFIGFERELSTWTHHYEDQNLDIYVFSAFLDPRIPGNTKIRVVSLISGNPSLLRCFVQTKSHEHDVPIEFRVVNIYKVQYASVMITCDYKSNLEDPEFVKIVGQNDTLRLKIGGKTKVALLEKQLSFPSPSIANCYQPIHGKSSKIYHLYFHVELMKIFGFDKFIVYYDRDEVSLEYNTLVDYYIKQGTVIPVPWKLFYNPKHKKDKINVWGQYSQIADCTLRFMHDFDYIFTLDYDEFIFPKDSRSWKNVLQELWNGQDSVGYFLIGNTYVILPKLNARNEEEVLDILTSDTAYFKAPCTGNFIDKYVCIPNRTVWTYMNTVYESLPGYHETRMSEEIGHKYHLKEGTNLVKMCPQNNVTDPSWRKSVKLLSPGFHSLCEKLFTDTSICQVTFR